MDMTNDATVGAIDQIISLLDSSDATTANTSMRIPQKLRAATAIAVDDLGVASSTTALANDALRSTLEAIVMQAALDDHYAKHPESRPNLAELAIAAAQLDSHPLAHKPELIRRAAQQLVTKHPNANTDDVLLWAEAQDLTNA